MASRGFLLSCIKSSGGGGHGDGCSYFRFLSPRPRYPSMPKYPKKESKVNEDDLEASREEEKERKEALFSVIGMTCSACAGSVEKAIKRLPGILDAAVDVLNNRAQVIFYPAFVNEDAIRETIEDVGFEAALIEEDAKDGSALICRIRIKGMTCTSCSSTVEFALQGVCGVLKV